MTEPKIMKHIITILLFIPILAFGQTNDNSSRKNACKDAQKEFEAIIQKDSNSYDAYIGLASCCYERKQTKAAISNCSKAIQLQPNNPEAYVLRSSIYYLAKDYENALLDFNKLIELDYKEKLAYAYFMRATCKLNLKKYNKDDICADFKKAKELGWDIRIPALNEYCGVTDL